MSLSTKKKLLVLDVNGLLVERFFQADKRPEHRSPDGKIGKFYVYKRPYCKEFLKFCFEKFEVGLWSSAQQHNVQNLVDFIFGDLKSKLVFTWHQSDCTDTGLRTLDNKMKPVFLKELYKLWNKLKPDLPWEEGEYGPFNTLLIDDSPYKAMRNPPHTAIFPYPYEVSNDPDDALVGALHKYLEGIAGAKNVQDYVKYHPFGQLPISKESPEWHFYRNILRLSTVNGNYSSIVETNLKEAADKTLPSIAYNCGYTSSLQCSVPNIEREDDGLADIAVSCTTESSGAIVTPASHKNVNFNGLQENGVDKVTNPSKKRRNSVREAALNQVHEAHKRSLMDKEAAFGISRQLDLDIVSKDDGCSETSVACMAEKNGAIVTTVSQKHVTLIGLEENDVDKATNTRKKRKNSIMEDALNQEHEAHDRSAIDKYASFDISQQSDLDMVSKDGEIVGTSMTERICAIVATTSNKNHVTSKNQTVDLQTNNYHVGNNTLKRSGRDYWYAGCSNRGHHYKASRFNKDYQDCSNHRPSYNFHTDSGASQTYHIPRNFERNCRHQNDVNVTHQTQAPRVGTYAQTNIGGSRTSCFQRKFERNSRHQTDSNSTIQIPMAQAGTYAQIITGDIQTPHFPRNFERNGRYQDDVNSTLLRQVSKTGTYAQTNNGGNGTFNHPRKFEGNLRLQNDVNAIHTQVARAGGYTNYNGFGMSDVPESLVGYQGGGYTNEGRYQPWGNQNFHGWDGSYGGHYENHNLINDRGLFSCSYSNANHVRQKSNDRKTHRSKDRFY